MRAAKERKERREAKPSLCVPCVPSRPILCQENQDLWDCRADVSPTCRRKSARLGRAFIPKNEVEGGAPAPRGLFSAPSRKTPCEQCCCGESAKQSRPKCWTRGASSDTRGRVCSPIQFFGFMGVHLWWPATNRFSFAAGRVGGCGQTATPGRRPRCGPQHCGSSPRSRRPLRGSGRRRSAA